MRSLKTKFVLVVSFLIIITVAVTGYFLIEKEKQDIKQDIAVKAQSFADLTVESIYDAYDLFYTSESFAYFRREIENTLLLNEDISRIQIVTYNGELLYDSQTESFEQYQGDKRIIEDAPLLERIQDVKASGLTNNRVVYFSRKENGQWNYTNRLEQPIESFNSQEDLTNIVFPFNDNNTRVIYYVSYENLNARIIESTNRILIILGAIVLGGIIFGYFLGGRLVKPIKKLTRGVQEIAKGNFSYQVKIKTKDELNTLADSFNSMAQELEASTQAKIEKEKLEQELHIAKKIQQDLLPKNIPHIEGLDIAASVTPAGMVGGDCYDFLRLDDDNTFFYVGDVTGHGVPASLVVSIANTLLYTFSDNKEYTMNTRDIVIKTNKILHSKTEPTMFVTAVLCNWDSQQKKFSYSSAGHEQIIHYRAKDKSVSLLSAGGMALGMLPDISQIVQEHDVDIAEGDFLVLYSDGIPEMWSDEKNMLGMSNFLEIIKTQDASKSAQEIHNLILERVDNFRGDYERKDDVTLMIVKREGKINDQKREA
jgi:serine phosphatase RsbU (regulator of sigma subunit)